MIFGRLRGLCIRCLWMGRVLMDQNKVETGQKNDPKRYFWKDMGYKGQSDKRWKSMSNLFTHQKNYIESSHHFYGPRFCPYRSIYLNYYRNFFRASKQIFFLSATSEIANSLRLSFSLKIFQIVTQYTPLRRSFISEFAPTCCCDFTPFS